ncbi:hypothetical protein ER308_20895 [Egibacter rhizosphaerae]|uniref:Phospholipid/glycerol acyltransferase domain-containing protein n=1 Tax=Egibacter rhizosphaerae TaxID=1670831 RepID=A0A411YKR6_9ACTN|nr:1-acyl-sn-glycerol-3-phosphate acyltransferase [Egibacter rhizosphaerae]QBI21771.1 hypothetical protein ER308_20895 [Egibacter rhizosphaerae]
MRPLVDRLLTALAMLALRGFFRDLEVEDRERVPQQRPTIVVANHFNALVDAATVVAVLGRLPRFVAKATLWAKVYRRPFLWLGGLVPVDRPSHRSETRTRGDRGTGGVSERLRAAFASCRDVLARGSSVAIFPEGAVSRQPRLAPVRTGTARIALGTAAEGVRGIVILPIGLTYEDKIALRSRALAEVGEPLDLDEWLAEREAEPDPTDRRTVRALTRDIAARLAAVSPDYADEREQAAVGRAAEVALRPAGGVRPRRVPLAEREHLARRLARAPEEVKERVLDALGRYQLDLALLGIRDEEVVARPRPARLAAMLAGSAIRLGLVAPFALAGAAINVLPYWGVHWAGRLMRNPVLKGSARLLVGIALFPAAWAIAAWQMPAMEGWLANSAVIVAAPVLGLIAVWALEDAVLVRRAWRAWIAALERGADLPQVRADRARVVRLVEESVAAIESGAPQPGIDTMADDRQESA